MPMPVPRHPRLLFAYTKLNLVAQNILVPPWGIAIAQAMLMLVRYLAQKEDISMSEPEEDGHTID